MPTAWAIGPWTLLLVAAFVCVTGFDGVKACDLVG